MIFIRKQMNHIYIKKNVQGKVAFVSSEGIHQLHIFIFVLAVFHVLYCILTLALGRAKVKFTFISIVHFLLLNLTHLLLLL